MGVDFGTVCDDFYVSCRLYLKLDLPLERETVLHFFDRIRKAFPSMSRFRRRDDGSLILEEETDVDAPRRWLRLEPSSLRFGQFAPSGIESVRELASTILEHAPYHLTFSELDFDHFEVIYGFDLEYRGNHDQIVADTFYADHPFGQIALSEKAAHAIDAQPYFGIALNPECDIQAYVEIKSRTTTFEIRMDEYDRQPVSVFLTMRKYWNGKNDGSLIDIATTLFDRADELGAEKVVPIVVNPLAQAIASRL